MRPLSPNSTYRNLPAAATTALLPLLLIAGCSPMQTAFQPPSIDLPAQFSHASAPASVTSADDRWWERFNDPQLTALIDEVLLRNNDLAEAAIKVRRAQLTAGISSANLMPQLGGRINADHSRNLSGERSSTRNSSALLTASYEIDLWQRLSSMKDAAQWEAHATQQDLESARLSMIATTAGLYWNGLFLRQSISNAQDSIAYAEKTLALVQVQYDAGAVGGLELLEAQQNLAGQRASEVQLGQQNIENDNALALLFDGPPRAWRDLPARLPVDPLPALAADVPAAVLARRPDLRAAELRLRSTLANADAVRTGFYPGFSLTGSLGSSSVSLLDLLSNPAGSIGLSVALPFLNWTTMHLSNRVAQADYDVAVVHFRQSLYIALSEVENTLAARRNNALEGRLRKENLAAAQDAERLYAIRYRAGAVPLHDFLNAQNRRRSAEIQLAENQKNSLNTMMTLYKALGGGN